MFLAQLDDGAGRPHLFHNEKLPSPLLHRHVVIQMYKTVNDFSNVATDKRTTARKSSLSLCRRFVILLNT